MEFIKGKKLGVHTPNRYILHIKWEHDVEDIFEYKMTKIDHERLEQAIIALRIQEKQWYDDLSDEDKELIPEDFHPLDQTTDGQYSLGLESWELYFYDEDNIKYEVKIKE